MSNFEERSASFRESELPRLARSCFTSFYVRGEVQVGRSVSQDLDELVGVLAQIMSMFARREMWARGSQILEAWMIIVGAIS